MEYPEAVRKHDGRAVAFDADKLALSIARAAASTPEVKLSFDQGRRTGLEIAQSVGAFLVGEGKRVATTADIRAHVVKALHDIRFGAVAETYADHARLTAGLLWRIRVVEPGAPDGGPAGYPWDRRRLLESLCAAGIARDPAGVAAREIERRLVTLGQDRVSPALIHTLTALLLAQRKLDVRCYNARRISFSARKLAPVFNAAADGEPLPPGGAALEAFWLQAVHSQPVGRAVRDNLLCLIPHPTAPDQNRASLAEAAGCSAEFDPLADKLAPALAKWWSGTADGETGRRGDGGTARNGSFSPSPRLPVSPSAVSPSAVPPSAVPWLRGDTPQRRAEIARALAAPATVPETRAGALNVLLQAPAAKRAHSAPAALPVTLNAAGLLLREAIHDPQRATVRLAQLAALSAQAQREREEYFNRSPIRGRPLPICVAGLWNAAAWLQGEQLDAPPVTRARLHAAATLLSVLGGAVRTLRDETGLELLFCGDTPSAAARHLWRRDGEFLENDGVRLDASASYVGGPEIWLVPHADEFSARLDFAAAAGRFFDEPPAVTIDAPLGLESDAAAWQALLELCAQAGLARLQLAPGGNARTLKALLRVLRKQLTGFPLFESLESEQVLGKLF